LAATCLSFFLLAGNFAMMPPATYKLFGPKNGALIYGIIYTAFASASIAVTYLSKVKNRYKVQMNYYHHRDYIQCIQRF
jgi:hypothetical protein